MTTVVVVLGVVVVTDSSSAVFVVVTDSSSAVFVVGCSLQHCLIVEKNVHTRKFVETVNRTDEHFLFLFFL